MGWLSDFVLNYKSGMQLADQISSEMIDRAARKQEGRIKKYMVFSALVIIGFIVYFAVKGFIIEMLILISTLHLHIIINYRLKKQAGIPQWETYKHLTKEQNNSKTG